MTKILFIIIAALSLSACGDAQNARAQGATKSSQKEYVEVLYFHGKQRCVTCNAIQQATKEVVEKEFAEQLKNGKVTFRVIDISTAEGEKIADKYEVAWSSLFVNKWKDGKQTRNNMTDFGFSHARKSPDVFKSGVKKKITDLSK